MHFPQENKVFQRPCRIILLPSYFSQHHSDRSIFNMTQGPLGNFLGVLGDFSWFSPKDHGMEIRRGVAPVRFGCGFGVPQESVKAGSRR